MNDDRVLHTAGPVEVLIEHLAEPRATRRSLLGALVRFGVSGALSVGADFAVLAILHSGLGVPLLWATLVGYSISLVINYLLNRNWTFQHGGDHRRTLARYAVVVGFNIGSTLLLVLGLTHLGLFYLLSKLIAVAINAMINFTAGRYWVFAHDAPVNVAAS